MVIGPISLNLICDVSGRLLHFLIAYLSISPLSKMFPKIKGKLVNVTFYRYESSAGSKHLQCLFEQSADFEVSDRL